MADDFLSEIKKSLKKQIKEETGSGGTVSNGSSDAGSAEGTTSDSVAPFVKGVIGDNEKKKKKKSLKQELIEAILNEDDVKCIYYKDGKCKISAMLKNLQTKEKIKRKVNEPCMTNGDEITEKYYCYNYKS